MSAITQPADYEKPEVDSDTDGNIFALIGAARRAMKKAGHSRDLMDEMSRRVNATQNYDAALQELMRWVEFT